MFCLKNGTDASWAPLASTDLDAVLVDHAHCELKAAQNALSLAARHPDNPRIVRKLAELAREEAEHFERVVAFLERRGVALTTPTVDAYAADLRRVTAALGPGKLGHLVDRLLVACLIEARSCERFKLLLASPALASEPELHAFYTELFVAEARHYRVFVDLAIEAANGDEHGVQERLDALSAAEARITEGLADNVSRAAMHG